jgi:hypothetical protein
VTYSDRQPLARIKNFGPVTLREFHAMGIEYLDQLEALGFEEVCRRWVEAYPQRLNANAFLGIVCTLEGTVWTQASSSQRAAAHALVAELRREYGMVALKRRR